MKVIIQKEELIKHKKTLKIAKLSKIPAKSVVNLTASEHFLVVGQGFKVEMPCKSLQWGTIIIPYAIWTTFFRWLEWTPDEITIEAEDGVIRFHTFEMRAKEIKVCRLDKIFQEIPLNATHIHIINIALTKGIDFETLRNSAIWDVVKENIRILRLKLKNAAFSLREYGVTQEDLMEPLIKGLGVKDRETFLRLLFFED